jgi:outer membrane protein OmpA-like peptidoglycan-associated protein
MRKLVRFAAFAAIFLLSCSALGAERFSFSYRQGDRYRLVTEVQERVFLNRVFSHAAEIQNRIAMEVVEAREGKGRLSGSYQTSERLPGSGTAYLITTDYDSDFWRSASGAYEIEDRYYMPIVRNVPIFPDRDLKPGDTWTAPGEERHDFRREYGIPEPYRIPFEARYEYLGPRDYEGKPRPAFRCSYTFFFDPPAPSRFKGAYPLRIMGNSDQLVFWDAEAGQILAYEETFKFIFERSDGITAEFVGWARGRVIEAVIMDRDAVAKKIEGELKRLGVEDVTVRKDEKGVVISLDKIQFLGDSAVLRDSEKEKLGKISEILRGFPDRDVLITGHTALASTEERRQAFSEVRARAVAEYLMGTGVITAERIGIRGMGAREPVADNATEEGMSRNRRVEIMILEN